MIPKGRDFQDWASTDFVAFYGGFPGGPDGKVSAYNAGYPGLILGL